MKPLVFAIAVVTATACASAFAQTSSPAQSSPDSAQIASNETSAPNGRWVPPYGQPTQPKTRAQVYQELVHAENDGQMAYLNSHVYFGS
ncbi:MAG TPA: DUF4148 domain-containing protein [Trinickia sp.]|jgi:hypothetical protein|uniref:DUF4148 domain-containing protein n=1 Tax=Trinickia sp. TaxID=2571163 RepID=UPI002B63AE54|nr:DUF4148 domain-containing protein [Trinickia sp.]HTI18061.1 DUF4148 domain-containing protein [Trinickia sp.]